MSKTNLSIDGRKFKINNQFIYEEIPTAKPNLHGLLMNARFIQGIFDSKNPHLFQRYQKTFDPDQNTDDLIQALPQWYAKGLRAITVGMQGGGSCFSIKSTELKNNPYSNDGTHIDPAYLDRLLRLIKACDELGMIVIASYFYGSNLVELDGDQAVLNIVKNMSTYLKDSQYKNIIIEIANEYDISWFQSFPTLIQSQGMVNLIQLAQVYGGGIPVGCSGSGGHVNQQVCEASDVVLIHGNGQTRSHLYNHIVKTRSFSGEKPIVINEDSQAIGQLQVCEELETSWGYYNNMTKQEPPTYWEITEGEDRFFAWRMADMIGIPQAEIPEEEQYYFQGFEPHMHNSGVRYPRIASLFPEQINYIRFYRNKELYYVCYDESFTVNFTGNWHQLGVETHDNEIWTAEIVLRNGTTKTLSQTVQNQ